MFVHPICRHAHTHTHIYAHAHTYTLVGYGNVGHWVQSYKDSNVFRIWILLKNCHGLFYLNEKLVLEMEYG